MRTCQVNFEAQPLFALLTYSAKRQTAIIVYKVLCDAMRVWLDSFLKGRVIDSRK